MPNFVCLDCKSEFDTPRFEPFHDLEVDTTFFCPNCGSANIAKENKLTVAEIKMKAR